jgi:preprotein translocase subunit SecG
MKNYLIIAQLVISALLMGGILLQARGSGLGSAFGGEGNVYRTKRGVEKVIFRATIVLAVAFLALSLATIILPEKI